MVVKIQNRFQSLMNTQMQIQLLRLCRQQSPWYTLSPSFVLFIGFIGIIYQKFFSTFWMMLATAPMPTSSEGYVWNARGKVHVCNTQVFFLYIGIMAAALCNCSFCRYYLAFIKYQGENRTSPSCYSCGHCPNLSDSNLVNEIFQYICLYNTLLDCWGRAVSVRKKGRICWKWGEGTRTMYSVTVAALYTVLPCVIAVTHDNHVQGC